MGNVQTTDGSKKSLKQVVDFVATNYILTQNFQDMRKLSDMKYCNKLVVLTSKVIANKFNDIEVNYLAQRTRDGQEINIMSKDNVKVVNKIDLPNLDVKVETDKRRLCIGIAKYYVKIAHIYAAIVTTIKPNYVYTEGASSKPLEKPMAVTSNAMPIATASNAMPMATASNAMPIPAASNAMSSANATQNGGAQNGGAQNAVEVGLPQKQSIPAGTDVKVKINNICSNRLNALLNNQDFTGENLTVKPNFCKLNLDTSTNKTRVLSSEPGIPELMNLYYNKYDYDHGGFTGFKSKDQLKDGEADMQAVYLNDVRNFYKVFTGEDDVPATVTTFSDIPLKAYHLSKGCQPNGVYTTTYKGTVKDKLFKAYANHVNEMMQNTETNQNKLLAIIDRLFVFNVNPVSKEREVTIKTGLTEKDLEKIVEETRQIIVNLYIKCEEDFLEGLEIFEAIVENQIKDTTQVQAAELQNIIDAKLGESDLDDIIEPVKAREEALVKIKEKMIQKEPVALEPVALEPVALEPVIEEPVIAEPVTLEPVALEPVALEPVALEPVALEPVALAPTVKEPLDPLFLEKAKVYLPSFVKGGTRRY